MVSIRELFCVSMLAFSASNAKLFRAMNLGIFRDMNTNEQKADMAVVQRFANSLKSRHWRAGTAESCTGGGIGWLLTSIPGSSDWFEGGLITYSNSMKQHFLGVPEAILKNDGAVSEACARAMADGARGALHCDLALSVTGVAGPGGGTKDKPVGLVCFGWSTEQNTTVQTCIFDGSREQIRRQSIIYSLQQAIEIIEQ